jgi:uncharacterized membrane protein
MSKKFDTNPLDPEFPERVRQQEAAATRRQKYEAETVKLPTYTDDIDEVPTRTLNEADFKTYSSAFNGAHPTANGAAHPTAAYKTVRLTDATDKNRKVAKVGLPENILVALPYIPFYIGLVAGILELLFVPKSEAKVRFHAAQGLAAHIGIMIVTTVLGLVGNLPGFGLADIGNAVFQVATMVMLIIFAVKAWQGEPVHIESVEALTEWFEEKIKPQN